MFVCHICPCRLRITLQSATSSDQDIAVKLKQNVARFSQDPRVRSAYDKLQRDYQRAHNGFVQAENRYHLQQSADLSLLTAQREGEGKKEVEVSVLCCV